MKPGVLNLARVDLLCQHYARGAIAVAWSSAVERAAAAAELRQRASCCSRVYGAAAPSGRAAAGQPTSTK